jgi:sec-independent protein translocase protein TatA
LRIFKAETKGLMDDDDDDTPKTDTQRSPEQRELGANPPSLDAESERQAAERRAADHRDDPA